MKVVLFCGGLGLRMRDYTDQLPKPMVPIGQRPLLWHVMRYFAHFGHKEFILCLGYRGNTIKEFFLNYDECVSNDFVWSRGGKNVELLTSDIHEWQIAFVDTGLHANIAERLMAARKYLEGEDMFLANYADGLTDLDFDSYLDFARHRDGVATFLSVKPNLSYHVARADPDGFVTGIVEARRCDMRINAGFFVLKKDIFEYILPGEELVVEPFQRLIGRRQLVAYEYDGFFAAMDTRKDKQQLDDLYETGEPPWEIWRQANRRRVF